MSRSWPIIAVAALSLLGFGLVMVSSAGIEVTGATAETPVSDPALSVQGVLSGRSGSLAGLSILAMALGFVLPVRRIAGCLGVPLQADRVSPWVTYLGLGFGVVLLIAPLGLVYTSLGHEANFSRRWLTIGSVRFQPSEVAKWGAVVVLAWYAARRALQNPESPLGRFGIDLLPAMIGLGLITVAIMKEDLGTAALVAAAGGVIVFAAGMRWLHLALLVPTALGALVVGVLAEPYRLRRVTSFLRPFEDPADSGYHMIQSMAAVAGGEITGRGLGHGLRKFGYLPEDTTDFVFAVVCEELGVFGAGLVVLLYAMLLGGIGLVAWRERHTVLQLFCIGVAAVIGLQAAINIAVVTGLMPTKGIALPLISMGGTGWILTCGCLGLVMAIARSQPIQDTEAETDTEDVPMTANARPA